MPDIEIKRIDYMYVGEIVRLHILNLQTLFKGAPGVRLLARYYHGMVLEKGAVGYIGLIDGKCCGFICGVWDSAQLKRWLIFNNLLYIFLWTSLQIFVSPSILGSISGRLFRNEEVKDIQGYELRPIIVDQRVRGTGLATLLVRKLEEDAKSRGYRMMHLYTESDNVIAQEFYNKVGFTKKTFSQNNSRLVYFEKEW